MLTLWVQNPLPILTPYALPALYGVASLWLLVRFYRQHRHALAIYAAMISLMLIWYANLTPQTDRQWHDEVAHQVDFERQGTTITVKNVRNFHWRAVNDYDIKWETRQYDLDKLTGVDLILSTWGMDKIAHTLLSFRFADGQKLAFSIEIRKEQNEQYSAIAGFFRKYELALIAADEKDIIYTRSNVRGDELVYLYPLNISKQYTQEMLLSYLAQGKSLQTTAQWYNSLTSNCTTMIYKMARSITSVPLDYRMIASGLLPSYLHEKGLIDTRHSVATWQKMALINPKTANFHQLDDQSSEHFSAIIRQ